MKSRLVFVGAALAALIALKVPAEKPGSKTARNSIFLTSLPYADPAYDQNGHLANGESPLPGSTPVYEDTAGECDHAFPITAPDGRQLTLAQWQAAKGIGHARCVAGGTQVQLKLEGLVPHGLYTIWVGVFTAPGVTPDFANLVGVGALGQPDGSQNWFRASAYGKGELSVLHPGGALSVFGQVTDCFLEESEVVLWPALHLDGRTHGGLPHAPDNPCTVAFSGGFSFKQ